MLLSPPKKYQFALFRSISITNRFRSNCPRRSLLYHSYFTALYLGWPLLNIYARGKSVWRSWVRVSVFRILFLCLAWRYHIRYGTKHTHRKNSNSNKQLRASDSENMGHGERSRVSRKMLPHIMPKYWHWQDTGGNFGKKEKMLHGWKFSFYSLKRGPPLGMFFCD